MLKNPKFYLAINLICIISLCYTVFAAMGYINFGPINSLTSPSTNIHVNGILLFILIASISQYSSIQKGSKQKSSLPARTIQKFSISFVGIFIAILALIALLIIASLIRLIIGPPLTFNSPLF